MSLEAQPTTEPQFEGWKLKITLFLAGQTVSLFGSMIVQYAVMWYIILASNSGLILALYTIFGFVPQAAISIFAGVWADRMNRKMLIIISDASIALVTLGLALMMMTGYTEVWLIILAVSIRSLGAGVQNPAVSAMIPQLVPKDQLLRINGIFNTVNSGMMLLAPALAGVVFGLWGIVPVFFIDVVTAVIGIGMLSIIAVPTLKRTAPEGEDKVSYFADLVEGMKYIWNSSFIKWLMALWSFIFILVVAPSVLTPLMLARTFGEEVWKLTVLEISFAVGMLIAGLLISSVFSKGNKALMIITSSFGFGIVTMAMGFTTDLWLFFALMFLIGFGVPFFSTPSMTVFQERIEPERQGRVFGFVGIVMALSNPIGISVFGPMADVISVEGVLIIAGGLTVLGLLVFLSFAKGRAVMRDIARPLSEITQQP